VVSRFPVGSSARIRRGRLTSARAIADSLLLPAGELARQDGRRPSAETDRAERVPRTLAVLGGRGIAVDERQLDVLARAGGAAAG